jgi:hypothetical protein
LSSETVVDPFREPRLESEEVSRGPINQLKQITLLAHGESLCPATAWRTAMMVESGP